MCSQLPRPPPARSPASEQRRVTRAIRMRGPGRRSRAHAAGDGTAAWHRARPPRSPPGPSLRTRRAAMPSRDDAATCASSVATCAADDARAPARRARGSSRTAPGRHGPCAAWPRPAPQPGEQAIAGRPRRGGDRRQRLRHRVQPALGDGIAQLGLAGEMPVDVGVAHAERPRDVGHRGLGGAVPPQQVLRRRQDALAGRGRLVHAPSCAGAGLAVEHAHAVRVVARRRRPPRPAPPPRSAPCARCPAGSPGRPAPRPAARGGARRPAARCRRPRCSAQARASWAGVTPPLARPAPAGRPPDAGCARRFSPWNRGECARKSSAASVALARRAGRSAARGTGRHRP